MASCHKTHPDTYSLSHFGPWKKSLNFIQLPPYVIPKSLKVSHGLSKSRYITIFIHVFVCFFPCSVNLEQQSSVWGCPWNWNFAPPRVGWWWAWKIHKDVKQDSLVETRREERSGRSWMMKWWYPDEAMSWWTDEQDLWVHVTAEINPFMQSNATWPILVEGLRIGWCIYSIL